MQAGILRMLRERGAWVTRIVKGSRAGLPDILAVIYGHAIAVEVKRPGGRVRPQQLVELHHLREQGAVALLCDSVSDFRTVLELLRCGETPHQVNARHPLPPIPVVTLEP